MAKSMAVRRVVFHDGERYPLLVDADGIPWWYPTLFATTQHRNAGRAPNTIAAVLSAIRLLLEWCRVESIDLETRFAQRDFLAEHQIESLCGHLQAKVKGHSQVVSIGGAKRGTECARAHTQTSVHRVDTNTQYIRMTYVAGYAEWLADRLVEREVRYVDADCRAEIQRMGRQIRARRPTKGKLAVSKRKGLSPAQRSTLLARVEPDTEKNPFSADVRIRNWLIVRLLYDLGLRQGELLSIQVMDIDFASNALVIPRRHDSAQDPRVNQPSVKTLDQRHPLERWLAEAIHDYVMGPRRMLPRTRRHPYLFVTHKAGPHCGQPLSKQGLNKMFTKLRDAAPESLSVLSPHVLRHTWNDRFSEWADAQNIEPEEEEKLRSHLMGWREGSGTAETYTRRHRERKAQEAALRLQRR